jgi:hypothetical protein
MANKGYIYSPGYTSGSYPDNVNCTWIIQREATETRAMSLITLKTFNNVERKLWQITSTKHDKVPYMLIFKTIIHICPRNEVHIFNVCKINEQNKQC